MWRTEGIGPAGADSFPERGPLVPGRSAAEVFAFVVAHGEHVFPVDTFIHFASVILLPPQANFSSHDNYLIRSPPTCHGVWWLLELHLAFLTSAPLS